jgi:predicted ATPase
MQQAAKGGGRTVAAVRRRFPKDALETIVNWTKLVLPELANITISADPHTGKYIGYLWVGEKDQSLRVPLQAASDGTLKWLILSSLILSRGGIYSLEEPENFLHPQMQQFLISLIRENLSEDGPFGYLILSTHSETIINQCRPEELVLFRFDRGKTSCNRLKNPEAVREEINSTGFGLGAYYVSNAVS